MKKTLLGCLLASAVLVACHKNDDDDHDNGISKSDQDFVWSASIVNTAEIDAGQLASSMAESEGVRQFGTHMVDEHTASKSELVSIANDLNIPTSDSVDAEHKALKELLMTLSGRAFDSVYIHAQVRDHQKAISLYESESKNGRNWRLRDYANKTIPHLYDHLHMADSLAQQYQ